MSVYGEKAARLFQQGSNCAQAVFCAYAEQLGVDSELAMKLSASFGGGFGRMREICGAVSGMAMIAGYYTGSTDPADQEAKGENYRVVQELAAIFKEHQGTIYCRDLLGLSIEPGQWNTETVPEKRTDAYYASRPCQQVIQDACEMIEAYFPCLVQGAEDPSKPEKL